MLGRGSRNLALLAVGVGACLVSASHNITTLYGGLFGLAAIAGLALCATRRPDPRTLLAGAGAALLGMAVNAWYLMPDVVYGSGTQIAQDTREVLLRRLETLPELLNPFPADSPLTPQLPVWVLAWLVASGVARSGRPRSQGQRRARRLLWAALAVVTVLMMWADPWRRAPEILTSIQFTLRLQIYAVLLVMALVVLVLRGTRSAWWRAGLALCVAAQAGTAVYVAFSAEDPSVHIRRADVRYEATPRSFELGQQEQFRQREGRRLGQPGPRVTTAREQAVRENIVLSTPPGPPGSLFHVDVIASPLVATRGGARQVGMTEDGFVVAEVLPAQPDAPWRASFSPSHPWPVRAGTAITVVALGAVGALTALWVAAARGRRTRSRRRAARARRR